MQDNSSQALSKWGWLLGVLFFPSGLFIVLACARVVPWRWAVILAISSYVYVVGFVEAMIVVEQRWGPGSIVQNILLIGGITVFSAWGWLGYRFGQINGYWSTEGKRAWRWAGRLAVVLAGFVILGTILQFTLS